MSTLKQAQARIAELEAKLADKRKVSVKHNPETGTVNVYGLRARFPVSMYPGEWDVIFAQRDAILSVCKVARPIAEAHRANKAQS
jgi:hypothetical protein